MPQWVWYAAIFVLAVLLVIALRAVGEMKRPSLKRAMEEETFKPWTEEYQGVEYVADRYSEEAITIEISLKTPLAVPLEINARSSFPELPDDPRSGTVRELLTLGANYIDIGFNTNRVAAEFPISMKVDRNMARRVAQLLAAIGELSGPLKL